MNGVRRVEFQHCAYGGDRPKWTAFLHFPAGFLMGLRAICPGESTSHVHKQWGVLNSGVFATTLETVYPQMLCETVADLLCKHLRFTAPPRCPCSAHVANAPFSDTVLKGQRPAGSHAVAAHHECSQSSGRCWRSTLWPTLLTRVSGLVSFGQIA